MATGEREEAIALLLAAPWWSLALKVDQACFVVSDIFISGIRLAAE